MSIALYHLLSATRVSHWGQVAVRATCADTSSYVAAETLYVTIFNLRIEQPENGIAMNRNIPSLRTVLLHNTSVENPHLVKVTSINSWPAKTSLCKVLGRPFSDRMCPLAILGTVPGANGPVKHR